jgi:hypothetical protein
MMTFPSGTAAHKTNSYSAPLRHVASRLLARGMMSLRSSLVVALGLLAALTALAAPASLGLALLSVGGEKIPDVGFDRLAGYPFTIVDAGTGASAAEIEAAKKKDPAPPQVRALDGQRVAVTGYMLPLQLENGRVKKLVLMRDVTTCCYGATPNMNDYIVVTMNGEGFTPLQDIPVVLVGRLHVALTYENGYLVSLYTLDGEKYLGPRK